MSIFGVKPSLFYDYEATCNLPSAFQQLILESRLVGYLGRRLTKNHRYLPSFDCWTMNSVLGSSRGIYNSAATELPKVPRLLKVWLERGLQMVRHILHGNLEIQVNNDQSPWSFIIYYGILWASASRTSNSSMLTSKGLEDKFKKEPEELF